MKRIIKISALLLFVTVFFGSCLEDADNDIVYNSDTAISSFSVTNFNTYHTTTSSKGEDSIYRVKEEGAKYKFYIDQNRNEIYNPDSLPMETDAKHLICAIGTRGGNAYIKNITGDSIAIVGMADSLNFESERVIKIISIDGKYERSYKVKVNVHKQLPDKFIWSHMGDNEIFAKAEDMKLVCIGKSLVMFVKAGDKTEVYTSNVDNSGIWHKNSSSFDAEAYKNAITFGSRFFIKSEGKIYSSEDAATWNEVSSNSEITRLAGSDKKNIYALSANGIMFSEDGGQTWAADALADAAGYLPNDEVSMMTYALKTNSDIERLVIIGNNGADKYANVWNKLHEYVSSSETYQWNMVEQTADKRFRLPQLKGLKVIAYADGLYAMGGTPLSGDSKAFQQIYFSRDGGITWHDDKRFKFPYAFMCDDSFALTTDADHHIWLVCSKTGHIWRGRLNILAWENKKVI